MIKWHPFYPVWGDLEKAGKRVEARRDNGVCKTGSRRKEAEKLRSKMVQVKGVMPPEGGLTHQTPTGRAVGKIYGWHNISGIFGKVMPSFIFIEDYKAEKERIFMSCRQIWEEHHI